ncbi:MAG: nucleotide exchange factor GrpE [Hyphomicrobiaceae bacterium]
MSGETHPQGAKPASEQPPSIPPQQEQKSAEGEKQGNDAPAAGADQQAESGPKAYVDPSIAAEARIAELEAEVSQLKDRYLRAYADSENLRKRAEREKSDISKYAITGFARDMVAIADNLGRAIAAFTSAEEEKTDTLKALLDGVELTSQELRKALEKHGVRSIPAEDAIFDPHKHQAVMEQEDTSVPAGSILQVFQEGYHIEDRVLRPSMVVVAKGGPKPEPATEASQEAPQSANDVGEIDEEAAKNEDSNSESEAPAADKSNPDDPQSAT